MEDGSNKKIGWENSLLSSQIFISKISKMKHLLKIKTEKMVK